MKKKTPKNKGITLIKKSNQLIESRYKFDVWETRVFLTLLATIRREDEDFKPYRVWFRDVIKTFGLKSGQSYGLLRDAARSLMRKVFNVSNKENGFLRETEYHIIRTVNYLSESEAGASGAEGQEFIDITFDPEMKPFLLQLQKNFTAYDLQNVVNLGTYPVRVYELLKQFETLGNRMMYMDEIKRMFELTNEYPLFANFYQKIIEPSVREINAHTDLLITRVDKVKEGRKYVGLYFVFRPKSAEELRVARSTGKHATRAPIAISRPENKSADFPNHTAAVPPENSEKDRLFSLFEEEVVQKFGVTPAVLLTLLDTHSEAQISQAIRVVRRAKANGYVKSSPAGFFVQALKNGYTDPKEEEEKRKAREATRQAELEALKHELFDLEDEQAYLIHERIKEITRLDPDLTERAIEQLHVSPISKPLVESKALEKGHVLELEDFRNDKVLRNMVKGMIVELKKEEFESITSVSSVKINAVKEKIKKLEQGE